jgi:hypothetical protein
MADNMDREKRWQDAAIREIEEGCRNAIQQIKNGDWNETDTVVLRDVLRTFTRSQRRFGPEVFPELETNLLDEILEAINAKGRNALLAKYPDLKLGQLVQMKSFDLHRITGLGEASIEQLRQELEKHKLTFGMSESEMRTQILFLFRSRRK